MCAINGFTFRDEELASKMNAETRHRGPDGSHVWSDGGVTFGHNRLSIIDVSTASDQPMKSHDGRYVIVYNGELYNFKELKKELGESRFRTAGDTEVILEAYAKWGKSCVERFNGMFALAIWDTAKSELFLARDHAGIKPLYYSIQNSRLIFSSEIKGVLVHSNVPRTISIESLNHYFRLLYVPEPLTMIESVRKLPQGSRAYWRSGRLEIETYFKPVLGGLSSTHAETISNIEKKVDEAIERQLISDRPLGVYLSGGIDSSVILDSMSRHGQQKIKTFSVGFKLGPGEESTKYNHDFDIAGQTARKYGTDHHEVLLTSDQALATFEEVVWHMDEPISNPTAWALFALSKATKKDATVVLCGDGGDELFGGYERYRLSYAASLYQWLPRFITNALAPLSDSLRKLAKRPWLERYQQFMFQKDDVISRILSKKVFDDGISSGTVNGASDENSTARFFRRYMNGHNFEEVIMETDRKTWLVDFALMLSDTMSMAHGVEARVPFLDKEVVEYVLSIPARKKLSLWNTKKLLKEAFAGRIPEYLLKQPKRGFFTPAAKWLRHPEFLKMARNVLTPDYAPATRDLFNWKEISVMLEQHVDRSNYNLSIIWALLTFQLWAKRFDGANCGLSSRS
jgi:asparagine synthase (glutamine-hydrolysing)